jgi:hypothetical protein
MAANTISTSFITEFEQGVHLAYQRMGSYLRGLVRYRSGVKNKTTFQKMGTGSATTKARNGEIPPMNIDHSVVDVTLEDWFAGEWIDDLDMLRQNHDEMIAAQESGARALGRKTDEQIKAAAYTASTGVNETTNGATLAWAMSLVSTFGTADVPEGASDRAVIVDYGNWVRLMSLDAFARAEYVGNTEVLTQGAVAKNWLGFYWMPYSGLTVTAPNTKGFAFHRSALGLAVGHEVKTSIQYYNTKDSHFVQNKMQMNAVLINTNGCYTCNLKT